MQYSASAPDRRSGRSLAVRVGALTAALSLMLVGGVAVASASSAAVHFDKGGNGNGNGNSGNNGNGGGNSGNNGNGGGNGNGNNVQGQDNHVSVTICHRTRSLTNPYVVITVDDSSINNLLQSGFNGHSTHNEGGVWTPSSTKETWWGDIIPAFESNGVSYPGLNWNAQGQAIFNNGCNPTTPVLVGASDTICAVAKSAAPGTPFALTKVSVPAEYTSEELADAALAAKIATDYTVSSNPTSTDPAVGCGPPCTGASCSNTFERTSAPSSPLCVVEGDSYQGVTSVQSPLVTAGGDTEQTAQDAADLQGETNVVNGLDAKAKGNNVIPPFKGRFAQFAGYNWNDQTQARFEAGCSPNQSVISAVLPGTIAEKPAGGNPQPGTVGAPAAATMPGSVNAGGGSSAPALPLWALALVIAGAIGAAASGAQLMGNRK